MKYNDLNMYNLLCNKRELEIKIVKVTSRGQHLHTEYTDEVVKFNDYYFVSTDIKALREKAVEIKEGWIFELEGKLNTVVSIKI